ncbi:MAG: hypothetical protein H7Z40_22985 [Phycisphaerae bacterium]|nr:hypothetical protein [Gemmatimonadaceae bacterium]
MRVYPFRRLRSAILCALAPVGAASQVAPPPASQNPSPMVESSRRHERLPVRPLKGVTQTITGPLDKTMTVFVPSSVRANRELNVVIYFHGDAFLPSYAAQEIKGNHIAVAMTLGAGSGVYDRTYSTPSAFDSLLSVIRRTAELVLRRTPTLGKVTLVGFSAGHGAVRAILRDSAHFERVHAVLLLDGMHTSYIPEGTVLATGGKIDSTNLLSLTTFARAAVRGEKRFLITHSEIFPGTFASTTETADYVIAALGLRRTPVLRRGPGGMQQLSAVKQGRFEIMGFAGNTAPDHIDHAQGIPAFLRQLLK